MSRRSETAARVMPIGPSAASGVQAIGRALMLLRLLARNGREGSRLTELSRSSGLPHPSVRRILRYLIDERMVVQDEITRRYLLGPLNFELGLATEYRLDFVRRLRPRLEQLARLSGDTVYLTAPSGVEGVCLDRVEGHSQILAVTLAIGGRRPLSLGAGGQALMACLSDAEVERILDRNAADIDNHPILTREGLQAAIERAREAGYSSIRDTTVSGVSAIGIAIDEPDMPRLAVSFAMVNERFTGARARQLVAMLNSEFRNALTTRS